MSKQTTATLLMIRPVNFGFNEQTAASNAFQSKSADQQLVQRQALAEFDNFVSVLQKNGVTVKVITDTPTPHTPDAIFPNNWISFHDNGDLFLYPMQAENRRLERDSNLINQLKSQFKVNRVIDLTSFEQQNKFLEGTGSMVLDREHKIAYACLSPRTDPEVLGEFCKQTSYDAVCFHAYDAQGKPVYHTNVLMCIASRYAVICLDCITDKQEKDYVANTIEESGKEVITITREQMNHFAGNMLEVSNKAGESLIVMSESAFKSLTDDQVEALEFYSRIVYAPLSTIEANGGGSARCMMAEVHIAVG